MGRPLAGRALHRAGDAADVALRQRRPLQAERAVQPRDGKQPSLAPCPAPRSGRAQKVEHAREDRSGWPRCRAASAAA
ncbi:MAG: hypothetical protein WDN49_18700 [Acetobacteraceae bacterium]